jgi:hypothetical protein
MLRKWNYFCCRCLATLHTHRLLTNTKLLPRRRNTKREECVLAIMAVSVDMGLVRISEACMRRQQKNVVFVTIYVSWLFTWRWQFRRREEVPHSSTLSHPRCFKMSSLIISKNFLEKCFAHVEASAWYQIYVYVSVTIFVFSSNHSKH